jgi:DNA (cytosine-5)-methyltransferase 1
MALNQGKENKNVRMLDLFSGIGGFSLAAHQVWGDKLDIVGFCEIDEYCCKILMKNFPDVPVFNDIKELDGKKFNDIFLMTGGFPCQDISIAGKGEGIEGKRSGLWSEMHRLISEVRPQYALIENVPMLVHRGLKRVLCDLAEIGYDAEWQIISAKHVGAPHLRYRIWIVAYPQHTDTNDTGSHREKVNVKGETELQDQQISYARQIREEISRKDAIRNARGGGFGRSSRWRDGKKFENGHMGMEEKDVSDSDSAGFKERWRSQPVRKEFIAAERSGKRISRNNWTIEPNIRRVANGVPNRVDRLKGLGNAVVPQVAQMIMESIKFHYY